MTLNVIRRLHWESLGCGNGAFHAALFAVEPTQSQPFRITPHDHDFFETLYVMTGTGEHTLLTSPDTGQVTLLAAGDLMFLRPQDCHAFHVPTGARLHWMNIAFPETAWESFRQAAGLSARDFDNARQSPIVNLADEEQRENCRTAFEEALGCFQRWRIAGDGPVPSRLHLCRFLSEVLPFLAEASGAQEDQNPVEPPWLRRACLSFVGSPQYLAEGLPRLVALSGVTYAHLARSLKSTTGRTPTQYVNDLRLARAALLLTTTPGAIIDIAGECGFAQLSYFYRQFRTRFGVPPHAYRQAARRAVGPDPFR